QHTVIFPPLKGHIPFGINQHLQSEFGEVVERRNLAWHMNMSTVDANGGVIGTGIGLHKMRIGHAEVEMGLGYLGRTPTGFSRIERRVSRAEQAGLRLPSEFILGDSVSRLLPQTKVGNRRVCQYSLCIVTDCFDPRVETAPHEMKEQQQSQHNNRRQQEVPI